MNTNSSSQSDFDDYGKFEYKKQNGFYTSSKDQLSDTSLNVEKDYEDKPLWIPEKKKKFHHDTQQPVSVFDVAAYILIKIGPMTTMKLHKLVYYCQAWSLVWDETSLFSESIEAWANGPVVRELFAYHRGMYSISSVPIGNPDLLSEVQKETINSVLDFYGRKSSQWLIDLTHMEEPWKEARTGLPDLVRGNRIITLDSMAEYYSSLPSTE